MGDTTFRAVSFQKVFFTYIPILSLELRTSFHEKQWTLLYLISKHYLLHLLEYWVRIMWILFWFHHQTVRPQGEFTCIMLWHKGLLIVWCVILKQSIHATSCHMKCDKCKYFTSTYKELGIHQRIMHEDLSSASDCKIFKPSFENKNSCNLCDLISTAILCLETHSILKLTYPHWEYCTLI